MLLARRAALLHLHAVSRRFSSSTRGNSSSSPFAVPALSATRTPTLTSAATAAATTTAAVPPLPPPRRQHRQRPRPLSTTSFVARANNKSVDDVESTEATSLPGEGGDGVDLDPGDDDDEEPPPDEGVDDGGVPWGRAALDVARQVLVGDGQGVDGPGAVLSLWSFKVHPSSRRVEVRLDKPSDPWGSPSLDDVTLFSRRFASALEERLPPGNETKVESGDIEVEASSAGAARRLRLPRDLERFSSMPLAVTPRSGTRAAEIVPKPHPAPLRVVSIGVGGEGGGDEAGKAAANAADAVVVFATADVRATRGNRGRLTKKQLEARHEVLVSELEKVTLYVDV